MLPTPALIALQFLTRLPVRLPGMPEPEQIGRSLLWYPLVGVLLVAGFAATAIQLFVFQPSFAINVSQKHILDTWVASASRAADAPDPRARILRKPRVIV